jgi:hypothetical protein
MPADFPARENFCRCFVQRSAEHLFFSSVLFIDEARFGRGDIINIHYQQQWPEENPHGVIHSRHQQQFSISVLAGVVGDWEARMFCHIGLQATTNEISSYMICQRYWQMYHWQSEHECGTCMMVLRHILAVLCELITMTPIVTDG